MSKLFTVDDLLDENRCVSRDTPLGQVEAMFFKDAREEAERQLPPEFANDVRPLRRNISGGDQEIGLSGKVEGKKWYIIFAHRGAEWEMMVVLDGGGDKMENEINPLIDERRKIPKLVQNTINALKRVYRKSLKKSQGH